MLALYPRGSAGYRVVSSPIIKSARSHTNGFVMGLP
jgi:hypothetical protein